jgi:hypothetical protein
MVPWVGLLTFIPIKVFKIRPLYKIYIGMLLAACASFASTMTEAALSPFVAYGAIDPIKGKNVDLFIFEQILQFMFLGSAETLIIPSLQEIIFSIAPQSLSAHLNLKWIQFMSIPCVVAFAFCELVTRWKTSDINKLYAMAYDPILSSVLMFFCMISCVVYTFKYLKSDASAAQKND